MTSKLFQPLQVGTSSLKNRLVLAPLTRYRVTEPGHVPWCHSSQNTTRNAASEATLIAPQSGGYSQVPGIWSQEQITAWKEVTTAVHKKGSFIYLQLWALGRAADPSVLEQEGGYRFVSSSDVPINPSSKTKPNPMTEEEIWSCIGYYADAAKKAVHEAGFDGVEIHGANGYLVDQFTQDTANKRTDAWGGSIEKRARFGIEVAKAVVAAVGAERTGIRLSPFSTFQGMKMSDPMPQFSYLVGELKKLKLAYLHLVEARVSGNVDVESTEKVDPLIEVWGNTSPILLAGGFKPESAKRAVDEQHKDKDIAVVFGRYFISNPDLVFRVEKGIELTKYEREKFYNKGQVDGYTTYPYSKEFDAAMGVVVAS